MKESKKLEVIAQWLEHWQLDLETLCSIHEFLDFLSFCHMPSIMCLTVETFNCVYYVSLLKCGCCVVCLCIFSSL